MYCINLIKPHNAIIDKTGIDIQRVQISQIGMKIVIIEKEGNNPSYLLTHFLAFKNASPTGA